MKILLAVDTSEASRKAVTEFAARPWPARSRVDVITVVDPPHLWATSETSEIIFRRSEELLRATIERLRSAGLDADGDVLQGNPKAAILDRARDTRVSLVVLGSNTVSAVEHFLLGNVAANVLRHAPCSVLIARARTRTGPFRVLLPTDGSSFSEVAARAVASRPWPAGTEFRVLSAVEVVQPLAHPLFESELAKSPEIEALRDEAMRRARDAVAATVASLSPRFPNVSESVSILRDSPRNVILNEAKNWEADLIVLGSHGRTGLDRFLLGSVSEGVATHASCSVEVIR